MSALDFEHYIHENGVEDSASLNEGNLDASQIYELIMNTRRLMGPL